jgi:DNA adenine methylase
LQRSNGWRNSGLIQALDHNNTYAYWVQVPGRVLACVDALRRCELECRPAVEVIGKYRHADVLIYADPPYMRETRNRTDIYANEMGAQDHEQLLDALLAHPGPVVLSGYHSTLYTERLCGKGWTTVDLRTTAEKGRIRTETLYLNPVVQRELSRPPSHATPAHA